MLKTQRAPDSLLGDENPSGKMNTFGANRVEDSSFSGKVLRGNQSRRRMQDWGP